MRVGAWSRRGARWVGVEIMCRRSVLVAVWLSVARLVPRLVLFPPVVADSDGASAVLTLAIVSAGHSDADSPHSEPEGGTKRRARARQADIDHIDQKVGGSILFVLDCLVRQIKLLDERACTKFGPLRVGIGMGPRRSR